MRLSILRVVQTLCRDPVMRLNDRHSRGKGKGGFDRAREDAKVGWL